MDAPTQSAWQPVTPQGISAFAHAPWRRLLLVQLIVAMLVAVEDEAVGEPPKVGLVRPRRRKLCIPLDRSPDNESDLEAHNEQRGDHRRDEEHGKRNKQIQLAAILHTDERQHVSCTRQ
jgi:hypothetical protein